MEIFKLADKPEIKEAFDALKEGAPAMGDMLGKMVDAAPSFATFLATVTEIINELTDSDQISAFFDTLNEGALIFKDFIQSDSIRRLLDNLGPIFATLSAIGLMFSVVKFAADVALGYIIFMLFKVSGGFDAIKTLMGYLSSPKGLGKLVTLLKGGGIIGLIIILISKAVEFYNKFSDFKEMVDNVFQGVKDSFSTLMEAVGGLFDKLFGEGEGSLLSALDPVIKLILEILIPALGVALEVLINVLTFVVDMASSLLDWIIPVITTIADGIAMLFEGDIGGFFKKMVEAFGLFFLGMMQFVVNGVINLANLLIRTINTMIGGVTNGKFGDFMKDVLGIDLSGFKIPEIANVDWTGTVKTNQDNKAIRDNYTNFGGPDRRAMGSVSASGITGMAERNMGNMDSYKNSQGSGSPITVNINPSAGMSEAEIGKIASREIAGAMRKGTI
jgi:phage-related protein